MNESVASGSVMHGVGENIAGVGRFFSAGIGNAFEIPESDKVCLELLWGEICVTNATFQSACMGILIMHLWAVI